LGRRIRKPEELARVVSDWNKAKPKRARASAQPQAVKNRVVYTEMSKFPKGPLREMDDCVWIEDTQATGEESAQYGVSVLELFKPAIDAFTYAAYGGLTVDTPVAFNDLGLAWEPIEIYDDMIPDAPRGITPDILSGSLALEEMGVYFLSVSGTFEHDASQQGRLTYIRMWNIEKANMVGDPVVVATGRNAEATTISAATFMLGYVDTLNNKIQLQIGNGDTYTNVIWNFLTYSLHSIGEFRGTLEP
jgi:hypothetical protein